MAFPSSSVSGRSLRSRFPSPFTTHGRSRKAVLISLIDSGIALVLACFLFVFVLAAFESRGTSQDVLNLKGTAKSAATTTYHAEVSALPENGAKKAKKHSSP